MKDKIDYINEKGDLVETSYKRLNIEELVLRESKNYIEDSSSDLFSTYHVTKYMKNIGYNITRDQVRSAFYRLQKKNLIEKECSNCVYKLSDNE